MWHGMSEWLAYRTRRRAQVQDSGWLGWDAWVSFDDPC
jgi:hypothetical protein